MSRNVDERELGSADLFSRDQFRNYFSFVAGSVRRRKRLVVGIIASIMTLTFLAIVVLPKTYHVESKLLAQRSQVLAVRGDGPEAVAPTRGAAESVLRRDNLVALVQSTDLVRHWATHRYPLQRLTDSVMGLLPHGEITEQDQVDGLVDVLEKRLTVWTADGTVSIAIDWQDAHMARRLVETAQQNFLESRYSHEITALAESIAIIKNHAGSLTTEIDDAVAVLEKMRADKQGPKADGPATASSAAAAAPVRRATVRRVVQPAPRLVELKIAMGAKQRVLDDLEQNRRQRLTEVQGRLVEQRATFTDNHPVVADLKQTVAVLSAPSPQVKALRAELATLEAEYAQKSGPPGETARASAGGHAGSAALPPALPSELLRLDSELREDRDPATVYARGQLRDAMDKYAAMRTQAQTAQIDLETAQAAFKYRYSVISPAQLPKKPIKPNIPVLLFGGIVAAIFAAIFIAVVADVRSGRLVERWQIEKLLDQPILGDFELPQLPRHPEIELPRLPRPDPE